MLFQKKRNMAKNVAAICLILFFATAANALAANQEVSLVSDMTAPAGSVYINVQYYCTDTTVTALGIRIHFDSSKLIYNGYDNYFSFGSIAAPQLQDDTENKDYNTSTNKLILIGYQDMNGNWPNQFLPVNLIRLKFTAAGGSTRLNVSKVTNAVGFGFVGTGITLNAPSVTTTAAGSITQSSAASGGNVTSAGGASVTARGVCWSTSQNPTTANSKTLDGSGTGSFTSSITGLSANTTYYVRAYAANSIGTGYGN